MPTIAVYDWSVVSHNGTLTTAQLFGDTNANDPASATYDTGRPSWVNVTYTYSGAPPTQIRISDDDPNFEDGSNETGAAAELLEDVTVNGITYPAGTTVENEFSLLQGGFIEVFVLRIGGDNVGMVPATGLPTPGPGAQFRPTASSDGDPDAGSTGDRNTETYDEVICFDARAMIATPDGHRPAGTLAPGDLVSTLDSGPQRLIWVGQAQAELTGPGDSRRPVRLRAGALGHGLPVRDLMLSPQHRVLIRSPDAGEEALGPAIGFLPLRGVSRARGRTQVTYVHLLLARHEVVWANDLLCESFFPGHVGLAMLSPEDRTRVRALWPGLSDGGAPRSVAARPLLTRRETEQRLGRDFSDRLAGPQGRKLRRRSTQGSHGPCLFA